MANISDALLILKSRPVSGNTGAYRITAGTNILQIGNDFGTVETTANDDVSRTGPRIVQFRGDNDLYALLDGIIYQYDGASTWSAVHTHAGYSGSTNIGLFVTHPNGTPTLISLSHDNANSVLVASSTDGTTWNTETSGTTLATNAKYSAVQYRDRIFLTNGTVNTLSVLEYNVVTDSWTSYALPDSGNCSNGGALHVYQNRLLALHENSASAGVGTFTISELIGGSFQIIKTLSFPVSGTGISVNAPGYLLFTDPGTGDLIAIVQSRHTDSGTYGTNVGNVVEQLTPSGSTFTSTDLTATVLPASERPGGANGGISNLWTAFRATDGSVHLWRWTDDNAAAPTGFISYMPWNGVGTLMGEPAGTIQNLSPFANAEYIFPWNVQGGGEHIWTLDEATIQMENVSGLESGIETLRFRVYGDGVTTYSIRFQYSSSEEFPDTFCTLNASTVTGGGSPTNTTTQVNGVVSDGSLYTVEWDIVGDGIAAGSYLTLKAVEA